jgi:glycine cleavage system regulatory protein
MSNPKQTIPLVLTVIGDDRPGLVEQLATAISSHHGNWLESSMSQLSGKFAGIVCISVELSQLPSLKAALDALPGLRITAESGVPASSGDLDESERRNDGEARGKPPGYRRLKLSLVGHDRIGIVREVSQVLARHAINVEVLSSRTASAPMSAEILFYATAELTAAASLDAHALTGELERISNDLMVDITLDETICA